MSNSDSASPPRRSGPHPVEMQAGEKYFWCACGKTGREPFCDGAHKGSGMKPLIYQADESKTAHFCGCGKTATQPFCDGSHGRS